MRSNSRKISSKIEYFIFTDTKKNTDTETIISTRIPAAASARRLTSRHTHTRTRARIYDDTHRLTSSADWAMKNPWVLAAILAPRGFIDILLSAPPSPLISIASSSSFSFVKHNLGRVHNVICARARRCCV